MNRRLLSLMLIAFSARLVAQDTPTEREAAREVLKKMAALEQSLDVPGIVTSVLGAMLLLFLFRLIVGRRVRKAVA